MASNQTDLLRIFQAGGYIAIGLPGGVSNLVIAGSILKYSAMIDQKELVILMGLALADGMNLLCIAAAGAYRLYVILMGYQSTLLTSWECLRLPHMWLWSFAVPLSNQMLVAVSVDRCLLVTLRAKYITSLGAKYAWGVVGGLFGFNICFALLAIALALTRGHVTPALNAACYHPMTYGSSSAISLAFQCYSEYSESLFPLLSVIVFACIGPMYVYQRNKVMPSGSGEMQKRMKSQQKLTRSIALSCLATFLLACIPGRLGFVFTEMDGFILPVCWLVVISNPVVNVLIYHMAHRHMRTAMHGLLSCKVLPSNIDLWPGNVPRKKPGIKRVNVQQGEAQK